MGPVQPSEHSERFVERLLRLLYWTTVRSERSLNGSKRQIGLFAIANKDGGAHRVFLITQKYSISPRLWAIREEFELISDIDRLLNSDRSACRPFAVASRKQNVRWAERAPDVSISFFEDRGNVCIPPVFWEISCRNGLCKQRCQHWCYLNQGLALGGLCLVCCLDQEPCLHWVAAVASPRLPLEL